MAVAASRPARPARIADRPVGDVEYLMLARVAQVRVDQQGTLAELRKQHGEIRGDVAAAFALAGAGHDQDVPLDAGLAEPADQQLGAQCAQLFGARMVLLMGRHQFGADAAVAGEQLRQLVQRVDQVALADQAEPQGRLTEAPAFAALQVHDPFGVAGRQLARRDQDVADVARSRVGPGGTAFEMREVFDGVHGSSLARPGQGATG